jgi:hypothetical protein
MTTAGNIVLAILGLATVVGAFWVLYGTHPRDPR